MPVLGVPPLGEHNPTSGQAGDGKVRYAARATYCPSWAPSGELAAAGSLGVDWRAGLELECRGFRKNANGLGTRKCRGYEGGSYPAGSFLFSGHRWRLTSALSPAESQLPPAGPCICQTSGTLDRSPTRDSITVCWDNLLLIGPTGPYWGPTIHH